MTAGSRRKGGTMRRTMAAVVLAATMAGCGGARFDATSRETIGASLKTMGQGMDEAQQKQFRADVMALTLPAMMKTVFAKGETKRTRRTKAEIAAEAAVPRGHSAVVAAADVVVDAHGCVLKSVIHDADPEAPQISVNPEDRRGPDDSTIVEDYSAGEAA